jgi:hypothetical protein
MSIQRRLSRRGMAVILGTGVLAGAIACSSAPPGTGTTSGSSTPATSAATSGGPTEPTADASSSAAPPSAGATEQAPADRPAPALPPIDAAAAQRFAGQQCRSQLAVLTPPTASLIETTNLTARSLGRIEGVTGSPRLADLAGLTGQNFVAGRGLLSVEADGTLRGRWAVLQIAKGTLTETGSVREDVVLGTGFGDARAIGGLLRGQGEPYPAVAVLRTDGRLELYRAAADLRGPLALAKPRTIATGLTSATAVTALGSSQPGPPPRTVLVLVADARGLTQYVVDVDHPASAPASRLVTSAIPAGVVGIGSGFCTTGAGNDLRPTGQGIYILHDADRRGHVYFGDWDQLLGRGSLSYVGSLTLPVSGGTVAP